jgi:hypothetical protein
MALVFDRAESAAERVVFVLGALSLAEAAAYLRVSPLSVGPIAGVCWSLLPGRVGSCATICRACSTLVCCCSSAGAL